MTLPRLVVVRVALGLGQRPVDVPEHGGEHVCNPRLSASRTAAPAARRGSLRKHRRAAGADRRLRCSRTVRTPPQARRRAPPERRPASRRPSQPRWGRPAAVPRAPAAAAAGGACARGSCRHPRPRAPTEQGPRRLSSVSAASVRLVGDHADAQPAGATQRAKSSGRSGISPRQELVALMQLAVMLVEALRCRDARSGRLAVLPEPRQGPIH